MIHIDCLAVAFQNKWTSGKAPEFHLLHLVRGFRTDPHIDKYNSVCTIKIFGILKKIFSDKVFLVKTIDCVGN